jgi:acetyltransferase-like isoleucine patch superfamily enzyme
MKEEFIMRKGVELGQNSLVEDYCILGVPPRGQKEGDLRTVIGVGAHVRSHTVGKNFQTGNKVNIRELNEIGDDVSIGTLTVIEHHVKIGNKVRIHTQVFIPEYSVLEEDAWIGPHVVLTNAKYPHSPDAKSNLAGPTIKKGAKIGANATILPGVVVGENARVIKKISELPY